MAHDSLGKILLFGGTGQVGTELRGLLPALGNVIVPARSQYDFADSNAVARVVRDVAPDVIVNAAAYNAVDRAEAEPDQARQVNSITPAAIAVEAEALNAIVVHYSTDYVFDGEKSTPYTEEDSPHPLSVYGESKLAGERGVNDNCTKALVLRTSWLYSPHGNNFLKTILRLAESRAELKIVDDQMGTPTSARLVAESTVNILRKLRDAGSNSKEWGVYHLSAKGQTTWYEFGASAIELARQTDMPISVAPDAVKRIATSQYPTSARRPAYSVLDTSKLARTFGIVPPNWEESIADCVDLLRSQNF